MVRLKLDEHLDERLAQRLEAAGHDVSTVRAQGMCGAEDDEIFTRCAREGRCLVTLDLDFANVLRFPPEGSSGLVVLRGRNQLLPAMRHVVENLIIALEKEDPTGRLWVVGTSRLRVHLHGDGPDAME